MKIKNIKKQKRCVYQSSSTLNSIGIKNLLFSENIPFLIFDGLVYKDGNRLGKRKLKRWDKLHKSKLYENIDDALLAIKSNDKSYFLSDEDFDELLNKK